eukprot:gene10967-13434_t
MAKPDVPTIVSNSSSSGGGNGYPNEIIQGLKSLPEHHSRFEQQPNDLTNFIRYVNTLISLKKKSHLYTDQQQQQQQQPPPPSSSKQQQQQQQQQQSININNVFLYIDQLKKSTHIASDLFEISCSNPVLMPSITSFNRIDHYNQSSSPSLRPFSNSNSRSIPPPSIPPKFNQAVYYNCDTVASAAAPPVVNNNNKAATVSTTTTTTTTTTVSTGGYGNATTTTTNTTTTTTIPNNNSPTSSLSIPQSAATTRNNKQHIDYVRVQSENGFFSTFVYFTITFS